MDISTVLYIVIGLIIGLMAKTILEVLPELPAKIPMHFDIKGRADAYYTKYLLWIFPVINTGILIFSLCAKMGVMPMIINSLTCVLMAYVTFTIIDVSKKKIDKIPPSFIVYIIGFIIMTIGMSIFGMK